MKMMKPKEIKDKVVSACVDLKEHWKEPKEGNSVPNKEVLNLCLGSSGTVGIGNVLSYISFSASCFLVGAVYGISFRDVYICSIIGMVLDFVFSPINMIIQDNYGHPPKKTMNLIHVISAIALVLGIGSFFIPNQYTDKILYGFPQILGCYFLSKVFGVYYPVFVYRILAPKFGKFRPWVIVGWLPLLVTLILLAFLPIQEWEYSKKLWVVQLLFHCYNNFVTFKNQNANIRNLMTSHTQERTKLCTLEQLVSGAFGGLTMLLLPIFAGFTGGMSSLETYKYIVPSFVLLFTPLTLIQAFGLKERVIVEENHEQHVQINMFSGFKQILRNKYLWIKNISNILNTVRTGIINIMEVMVVYAMRQDYILGVLTGLSGCFATIGLPFVPAVIKKFGLKNTYIATNFLQLFCFGIQVLGVYTNSIVLLFLGLGSVNFFNIFACMANEVMTPEIWDYQQYISGERLESSANIFGIFTSPLVRVISLLVPAVYAMLGFTSDWNVLYFDDVRNNVFLWTIGLTVAGIVLSVLPYFFYDMNEKKHQEIIKTLQERADQKQAECEQTQQPDTTEQVGIA